MNNLSFLFLVLSLHQVPSVFSYYNATDSIFLSCGTSESTASPDGRIWVPDSQSKFGPFDESDLTSRASKALNQGTSTVSVPYMSARISRSPFTYSFPLTSGQKFIRLHFHPTYYEGGFAKFNDWFNVKVGPFTFLRNFSASLFANEDTFFREFSVNVGEEQSLNITFAPFSIDSNDSYVFINGIEIVPMPSYLYYTSPGNNRGVGFVGENRTLRVENSTALGTVCRLNIGGSFIRPEDDTGMLRSWNDDSTYQDDSIKSIVATNLDANLNYSKIQPFVAPDTVYISSRLMDTDSADKLIWDVPVFPGFTYLVRLHFCEQFDGVAVDDNRFDILIDNKTAELGFDVVEAAGGNFIPIYKDYLVIAGKKGETKDYQLSVTILKNNSCLYPSGYLNGMEIIRLNDSEGSLTGPNPHGTLSPGITFAPRQRIPQAKSNRIRLIVAIGGSVIGLSAILSMLCLVFVWRRKQGKNNGSYSRLFSCCRRVSSEGQSSRSKYSSLPHELCHYFSLDEIKAATKTFDEKFVVGEGGFGPVYKGEIDGGVTRVAIKRLNQYSKQGTREFKTEIELLSKLRHMNLVSLIGYCMDEGEMILVYEFMPKGTLREHLYGGNNDLSWKQRLEICIGAARGLDYLHTGTTHMIIHRDIKTTNILLDENLTAKVSDFGLSKMCVNNTTVSTFVKGTVGYMDPEYARLNHLTEKSDVYSFGVVLFEVLCARKAVNIKLEHEQQNLALWARNCIEKERVYNIIDPHLIGKISPDCFNKFIEIAESCTRNKGAERPSMRDVKEKLEFALELQEAADAETGNKGIESVYPEVSFCAPRYTNVVSDSIEESRKFSTSYTSYYGLDSSSGFESRIVTSTCSASTDVTE